MGGRRVAAALGMLGLVMAGCGGSGSEGASISSAQPGVFSIAIWGDTPYGAAEAPAVPTLIDQVNRSDVLYTVFVGDLQGSPRCDNAIFTEARDRFDSFSGPMVYVPGDNEWTDCHVGGQDPIERLAHLRKVMFPSNQSFGKRTLTVQQQPQYPENSRWETKSVVFAGINVPGSNNNHIADVDVEETGTPAARPTAALRKPSSRPATRPTGSGCRRHSRPPPGRARRPW